MTLQALNAALLIGGAIVLISVVGVRLAGRLGVPGLLLYLVVGLALGTFVPGLEFTDASVATVLGSAALIVILAQGGLTTHVSQLTPVMWPSLALASVGVAASIALVALPLVLFTDVPLQLALLLGTVLAATDAAAVFSVMRKLKISVRLRTLLEAEAGFNDAPVVVLVSVIASGSFGRDPWWLIPFVVVLQLIGGAAVGVAVGYGARWLLPRLALPALGLYPIAAMALLVMAFGLAAFLQVSGFMAVYIAAVLMGSAKSLPHRRGVEGFAEGLAWIAEIGLFVMLGLLADVERLPAALGIASIAVVASLIIARPIAVIASLAPFRWGVRQTAFVSLAGLRGAVPIVFAALALGLGIPGAQIVFDATLLAVLILLLIQTPLLPWFGRRIGVEVPDQAQSLEVELAPLDAMNSVVMGVEVPRGSKLVGVFVPELALPGRAVVSLILRGGVAIVPDNNTRFRAGDQVMIITESQFSDAVTDRISRVAHKGKLADWIVDRGPER